MKWMNKLKEYAPDIATAVLSGGATLPQLALKAVADATGQTVSNETEMAAAIESASPEAMLKIQQANNSFKIRMAELANELTDSELGDVQHAREQHKHSVMPAVICISLTMMVAGLLVALFKYSIPEANSEVVYLVIGQVITLWAGSVVYWIGTTRSSAQKTTMLGKK